MSHSDKTPTETHGRRDFSCFGIRYISTRRNAIGGIVRFPSPSPPHPPRPTKITIFVLFQPTYAVLPKPGEGQVRFFNGFTENITLNSPELGLENHELVTLGKLEMLNIKLQNEKSFTVKYSIGKEKAKEKEIKVFENLVRCHFSFGFF